jgi:NAD(P)-dependent dehydrogenase (short-subunit alcohol dehydrogenase family)
MRDRFLFHIQQSPLPVRQSDDRANVNRMSAIPTTPPSRSLAAKCAIVTGAGCAGDGIGNGRAIAILLASDGCNVLCVDKNLEWAEKTVSMIQEQSRSSSQYGQAISIQADVTRETDCSSIVAQALSTFKRVDILINNVGIAGAAGTAVTVDMESWSKSLEVNVNSMVLMAKHAIPAMQKNSGEIKGSIVNMGSVAGLKGGTPHLLYPTSKGAVVNMTRAMAAHHAEDGIRVNCVCPGVWFLFLPSPCALHRVRADSIEYRCFTRP